MKIFVLVSSMLLSIEALSSEIAVNPDEIKDFSEETGVGCTQTIPDKEEIIHILCKSKISADSAWNASMYRAKFSCKSQKFEMLFRKPPMLPEEKGVFSTQMEIKCK